MRKKTKKRTCPFPSKRLSKSLDSFLTLSRDEILADAAEAKNCKPNLYDTKHGPLLHLDRDSQVLGVAHLDTVDLNEDYIRQNPSRKRESAYVLNCPQLDDRLGAWVLLSVLPAFGVETDILLTDSEEIGQSTAQYFSEKCDKEYNWIYSFDRAGSDVVLYQYETPELVEKLESIGFSVGMGSYSDIAYMEGLGISGFNFGAGYHRQHTAKCYAALAETQASVLRFKKWFETFEKLRFAHVPKPSDPWGLRGSRFDLYDDDKDDCSHCSACRSELLWSLDESFCPLCDEYEIREFIDEAQREYRARECRVDDQAWYTR